jgi:branched-chain amino acid transport system substrate-binding protein
MENKHHFMNADAEVDLRKRVRGTASSEELKSLVGIAIVAIHREGVEVRRWDVDDLTINRRNIVDRVAPETRVLIGDKTIVGSEFITAISRRSNSERMKLVGSISFSTLRITAFRGTEPNKVATHLSGKGGERTRCEKNALAIEIIRVLRQPPRFMKLCYFLTLAGLAVLSLSGCQKSATDQIVVGEVASMTGKEATFGISSHEGTVLAIEETNAAGGVLGKKIKLIMEDNQSKAGESANAVNKLIAKDGAVAILGEVASSRSLEAAPICQQNQVPQISPSSTNPKVTETGDFIFRVCFIDPFQGTVMANFAHKTLKAQKVAVFTDVKSDYSKGLARFFKEGFAKTGGQLVAELDYNGGDKDFKGQLTAIKAANPEGVFVPGYYTDVALICIQAREVGLNVPFFGGDGWESEKLTEIGKEAVEGHYFSTHYSPDAGGPKAKAFVDAYKKRFSSKAPDAMAALGYDSAMILFDAMRRADSTEGPKVRDALASTKDYDAVTGKITINQQRDADKSAVILQVKDGKFAYVETIAP